MSSVLKHDKDGQQVCFTKMNVTDVEDVIAVEQNAYPFPWTRGNFLDSLEVATRRGFCGMRMAIYLAIF